MCLHSFIQQIFSEHQLKFQYFSHLMQGTDILEKTLMLGKTEGRRRRGRGRMRWLDDITDSMDMSLSNLWELGDGQGSLECRSPWGHNKSDTTERVSVQFSHSVMSDSLRPHGLQHQASLSITNSHSLLKLMSIESVMLFNHLILCLPLLL